MATRRRHDQKVNIGIPRIAPFTFEFTITGKDQPDWDRLYEFIGEERKIMQKVWEESTKEFSHKIFEIVKTSLQTGKPPRGIRWVKHAESTKRVHGPGAATWGDGTPRRNKKKHNALVYQDYPLLHLKGNYEKAVSIFKRGNRILVGLPSKGTSTMGGISMNALAIILEYGSGRGGARQGTTIPPRPLWRPALKQVGGAEALEKILRRRLADKLESLLSKYAQTGITRKNYRPKATIHKIAKFKL